MYYGRTPRINYFHVYDSKCFILNTKDYLTKFDHKSNESIFLDYSLKSKAYRVFNKKTMVVEESMNVTFDESKPLLKYKELIDEDQAIERVIKQLDSAKIDDNIIVSNLL